MAENIKIFFNSDSNGSKTSKIVHLLTSFRVDIKNTGKKENDTIISGNEISIQSPNWAKNDYGNGWVIQGNSARNVIKIKVIKDGILKFSFMGIDKRFEDKRIPIYADYKFIKIDGKDILSVPISTWHDQPFRYEMPVKDGQEITLEFEQQHHKYNACQILYMMRQFSFSESEINQAQDILSNWIEDKYDWIFVKNNLLENTPTKVTLNELDKTHFGRLTLPVGKTEFEALLLPSNIKKLHVTLAGAGARKLPYPLFNRVSWCAKFNGVYLCLDDPTRFEFDFSPSFYFGSPEQNYLEYVIEIVKKVASVYGIANEDITFISSSNGGFASLWLTDKIVGASCIVHCPQVDIPSFVNGHLNGWNTDDPKFKTRINLEHLVNNTKSKFFIYSNIMWEKDKQQMELLFKFYKKPLRLGLNELAPNMWVLLANISYTSPHMVQPDEWFTACIEKYIHAENKFPEYVFTYLIEETRRYYDLLRQKESLENMIPKD